MKEKISNDLEYNNVLHKKLRSQEPFAPDLIDRLIDS